MKSSEKKKVTFVEILWWGSEILILCESVGKDLGQNVETLNLGDELERRGKEWVQLELSMRLICLLLSQNALILWGNGEIEYMGFGHFSPFLLWTTKNQTLVATN